jgi:hypothetical protein
MHLQRLVIHGLLVTGLLTGLELTAIADDHDNPPRVNRLRSPNGPVISCLPRCLRC